MFISMPSSIIQRNASEEEFSIGLTNYNGASKEAIIYY